MPAFMSAVANSKFASLDCPLWVQFFDSQTGIPYFYNVQTHERVSTDPDPAGDCCCAVDELPHASSTASVPGGELSIPSKSAAAPAWRSRPACVQREFEGSNAAYQQGNEDFNVWYGRFENDRFEKKLREPASYKCDAEKDSGWTLADQPGQASGVFCIYFAQGRCYRGSKCTYHHHIPTQEDSDALDLCHDIFGRARFSSHRDDMGGVGSFNSDCLSIFIGDLCFDRAAANPVQLLEGEIRDQFGTWGPIEDVKLIPAKGIAFVHYAYRAAAEFAIVAMHKQRVGLSPVIAVRWAFDNPDVREVKRRRRETLEKGDEAVREKLASLSPVEYASLQLSNGIAPIANTTAPYPDTSAQYATSRAASRIQSQEAQAAEEAAENVKRMQSVLARIDAMHSSGIE